MRDESYVKEYYDHFIHIVKFYEQLHEYGGIATISEILAMPFPMFNDLIKKQVELKKKEREAWENAKGDGKGNKFVGGKVYRK